MRAGTFCDGVSVAFGTKQPVRSARGSNLPAGGLREIRAVAADNGPTATILRFRARNELP